MRNEYKIICFMTILMLMFAVIVFTKSKNNVVSYFYEEARYIKSNIFKKSYW